MRLYYKIKGCLKGSSAVSHICDQQDSLRIPGQIQNSILEKKMRAIVYISDFYKWGTPHKNKKKNKRKKLAYWISYLIPPFFDSK